jgi:hypothetical protein
MMKTRQRSLIMVGQRYKLLFSRDMFCKDLNAVFLFEFADESWIPGRIKSATLYMVRNLDSTNQSSLATPKSLQHRINALLLHASVAVGMPEGSKYSCSPLAIPTNLQGRSNNAHEKEG